MFSGSLSFVARNMIILLLSTAVFFLLVGQGYDLLFSQLTEKALVIKPSLVIELLYQFLLVAVLWLNRWVFLLTFPVLLLVGITVNWFETHLGIEIDQDVLEAVLATDSTEVHEILSLDVVFHLGVALLLGVLLVVQRFKVPLKADHFRVLKRLWFIVLFLFLALGVRYWLVPVQFVFYPFNLKVSHVPSGVSDKDSLIKKLWSDTSGNNTLKQKQALKKGRLIYDITNIRKQERLRLYASKGDFSIVSPVVGSIRIKRYYDKEGAHLRSRLLLGKHLKKYVLTNYQPFFLLQQLLEQVERQKKLAIAASRLKDIAKYASLAHEDKTNNLIVVLIIGEAARADHFQLNGYERHTTPHLASLPGIVNYPHVKSCAASTTLAIPCMVTRMRANELPENILDSDVKTYIYQPIATENSFVSLFSKHRFNTAWLSMNQIYGRKNTPVSAMVKDANYHKFLSYQHKDYKRAMDGQLIPEFDKFLKKDSGRKLIVLHTRGSHWRYSARYPDSYKQFKPACNKSVPSKCTLDSLVNAYDNSIVYSDHFIHQIIRRLMDKKALLVYTSDHGESLGEEGVYTHSVMSRPEQRSVPMFWWVSKKWQQDNPRFYANLNGNAHYKINHDYLFHSLLDCSGIESEVISKELSLCQNLLTK